MLNDDLARIIRWYKGRTSFEARKVRSDFAWQPRFHDHIIRNAKSYQNIYNYILNNPVCWQHDAFYSVQQ
jgi:REP element-mobilizing transposase RayT